MHTCSAGHLVVLPRCLRFGTADMIAVCGVGAASLARGRLMAVLSSPTFMQEGCRVLLMT
jgi:hypothetical protein